MSASQITVAGSLRGAADRSYQGLPALRPFRPLLDQAWSECEGRLARLALALGLRSEEAADVLQDVYVMAIQQPPAIGDEPELVRWLFRVTVNRCHLEHRRHGRWQRLWTSLARVWQGEATSAIAATTSGELKQEVERALGTLENNDRAIVAMRYFSDLNSREIAQIVGMPEATVRGRLRVARRKLAQELADWNDDG